MLVLTVNQLFKPMLNFSQERHGQQTELGTDRSDAARRDDPQKRARHQILERQDRGTREATVCCGRGTKNSG